MPSRSRSVFITGIVVGIARRKLGGDLLVEQQITHALATYGNGPWAEERVDAGSVTRSQQIFHRLKLAQIHLARQRLQKMRAAQAVHDRAFDFAQVQGDARFLQACGDGFQAFERAGVDVVDGAALQDQVRQRRMLRHFAVDAVFQRAAVGELQVFIHAQTHHARMRNHFVAVHIAKVFGALHLAHFGNMRSAGT